MNKPWSTCESQIEERDRLEARIAKLEAALRRIVRWADEFPPTGRTWQDGTVMSYGAAFGSNGERDYMRAVARTALETDSKPDSVPCPTCGGRFDDHRFVHNPPESFLRIECPATETSAEPDKLAAHNPNCWKRQYNPNGKCDCGVETPEKSANHYANISPVFMVGSELPCTNCGQGIDKHGGLGMPCPASDRGEKRGS